jgi:glycosyltransferase involved in cell wall biosynthesis
MASLAAGFSQVAVLTSDKDLGATTAYPGIRSDVWSRWRDGVRIRYCGSAWRRMTSFVGAVRRFDPDTISLNSMFSLAGTLWPLLWLTVSRHRARVVLAPRGMLKPAALKRRRWKKAPVLFALRWLGLLRGVTFHATSAEEVHEISAQFGAVPVLLLPNIPAAVGEEPEPGSKLSGSARLCFVGRIHPTKNLLWLLHQLSRVEQPVQLTVIGPDEEAGYSEECRQAAASLPARHSVVFTGPLPEPAVRRSLAASDALVLPTQGENFGHAIFESLAIGRPVIISDQTIWRQLTERQAGWDLPLGDPRTFVAAIDQLARMPAAEHTIWCHNAHRVAADFIAAQDFVAAYRRLFFPSPADDSSSSAAASARRS